MSTLENNPSIKENNYVTQYPVPQNENYHQFNHPLQGYNTQRNYFPNTIYQDYPPPIPYQLYNPSQFPTNANYQQYTPSYYPPQYNLQPLDSQYPINSFDQYNVKDVPYFNFKKNQSPQPGFAQQNQMKMNPTQSQLIEKKENEVEMENGNSKGILPQERKDENREFKKKMWQNDLLNQIEEKKRKDAEAKLREIEQDRLEEDNFKIYLHKKKEQENQHLLKRKNKIIGNVQNNNVNFTDTIPINERNNLQIEKSHININPGPVIEEKNIEMSFKRNKTYEEEMKMKEEEEIEKYKRNLGLTFDNLNKTLKEDLNEQISKLKAEVSGQYVEMSDIFSKLKMDVQEASQLKFEAERELNQIRDELERRRVTNIIFEEKFTDMLEKHAPYNNMHIPIHEVHPLYKRTNKKVNIKSSSAMVYNKEDMVDEKTSNRINKMSNLAKYGQSLVGESEFIPISEPKVNEKYSDEGNSKINPNKYIDMGSYQEMYSKLNEIADLNSKIDPSSRYKTLKKKFEVDFNEDNHTNQREELKKLDNLLDNVVKRTNRAASSD